MAALSFLGLLGVGGYQLLVHPDTPLPDHWNPVTPLRIDAPLTPLTGWKLNRAAAVPAQCLASLDGFAAFQPLPDRQDSPQCGITGRVALDGVGTAGLASLETSCAIALRLAMWERHALQPAAQQIMASAMTGIDHIGSYNCRAMRTSAGTSTRMSTHATAAAVDIAGFRFADGTQLRLIDDWAGDTPAAAFLRAARDSACDWFELTLSPDFNSLHADHFHLQSVGWGGCR